MRSIMIGRLLSRHVRTFWSRGRDRIIGTGQGRLGAYECHKNLLLKSIVTVDDCSGSRLTSASYSVELQGLDRSK
jgi:hypothetical protein